MGAGKCSTCVMLTDACVLCDNQHRTKNDETQLEKGLIPDVSSRR